MLSLGGGLGPLLAVCEPISGVYEEAIGLQQALQVKGQDDPSKKVWDYRNYYKGHMDKIKGVGGGGGGRWVQLGWGGGMGRKGIQL